MEQGAHWAKRALVPFIVALIALILGVLLSEIEGMPSLIIELDTLPTHESNSVGTTSPGGHNAYRPRSAGCSGSRIGLSLGSRSGGSIGSISGCSGGSLIGGISGPGG
jgi:hypothetical protein